MLRGCWAIMRPSFVDCGESNEAVELDLRSDAREVLLAACRGILTFAASSSMSTSTMTVSRRNINPTKMSSLRRCSSSSPKTKKPSAQGPSSVTTSPACASPKYFLRLLRSCGLRTGSIAGQSVPYTRILRYARTRAGIMFFARAFASFTFAMRLRMSGSMKEPYTNTGGYLQSIS